MKNMKLRKYALSVLRAHECQRCCYFTQEDTESEVAQIVDELGSTTDEQIVREIFAHPEFSAKEIVTEFFRIGDEFNKKNPPKKSKYHLIWDNDNCTDGYDCGNNKMALKGILEDFYCAQMDSFVMKTPENQTREMWDRMIDEYYARVYTNADLDRYEDTDDCWCYELTTDDFKSIGFVSSEEMSDEEYAGYVETYGWPKRD